MHAAAPVVGEPDRPALLRIGDFELDLQRGELRRPDGTPADLRRQALDVLLALGEQAGHVVGRAELMQRVWPDVIVTDDSLTQAVADIRRVLGDRSHTLVRNLPRRGYLLALPGAAAAQVAFGEPAGDGSAAAPPNHIPEDMPAGLGPAVRSGAKRLLWASAVAAVIACAAGWWWLQRPPPPPAGRDSPQIAVLAFRDRAGTPEGALLGRGLAEDMIMQLGRNQGLNVVAHHSSFAVSDKGLPTAELGRQLRAQYLVDGVVQRDGERLNLEVELIDVRADKVLWVAKHQTEGGAVVQARDEILARVAGSLFSKLRETEKHRAAVAPPKSLDVYALTQKGLALKHLFTAEATREARAGLERALAADPHYAPAWWVLGWLNAVDVYFALTDEWPRARMPEAIAQINRGIELDPNSPGAWQALSVASLDPRQALEAAQRAVELAPGDAEAWLFHGLALMALRPPEQALRSVKRAIEMNPIPPTYFQAIHAMVLWPNGQYDAARAEAEECLRKAPGYRSCRAVLMVVHGEAGRLDMAREQVAALGRGAESYSTANACLSYGDPPEHARCLKWTRAAGLRP